MRKAEKICKNSTGPAERRENKKRVRRARRRLAKADIESPGELRYFTRGWTE